MTRFFKSLFAPRAWIALLCCMLVPAYLETVLHIVFYRSIEPRFFYILMFSACVGTVLCCLCMLVPKRAANAVFMILISLLTLYFEIQLVYHYIFSEFMSVWQFSFGATAVTNFWRQMLYGIWQALIPILALLLPIPVFAVLTKKKVVSFARRSWGFPIVTVLLFFALHYGNIALMQLRAQNSLSVYSMYCDRNLTTESSVRNLGLISTARLEIRSLISGDAGTSPTFSEGVAVDIPKEKQALYNMLDLDFESLSKSTEDEELQFLDNYFHTQIPTRKNKYTGLCSDYNLIVFCAESFSAELIDPELTPTLYRLSNEGFIFNNYYGCFTSNTTNGEYSLSMGLFPDLSRKKSSASLYASGSNYLPFCLGNQFRQFDADAWAYHDYLGSYYNRDITHPNMGYTFKSVEDGLDMQIEWPASDLEMIQKSVGDYINSGKQFCAYYMTFSGHYQYNWENPMSLKNRSKVDHLPYSDTVKAYIACNLELEYALEELCAKLEEAGIADKTVIVLTNDHYPYGLTGEEYNELAGRAVDPEVEKYRNSFICYVPGVHEEIDTYCCTVDILPTLSNLFGLSYDSRLLSGQDVLSPDARNCAILYNKSFITPKITFNAERGTAQSNDGSAIDDAEVERYRKAIDEIFDAATMILDNDYYRHAIKGETTGGETYSKYDFEDMPETVELGAVRYVFDNGYYMPKTDTYFGFYDMSSVCDLYLALYRIAGSPAVTDRSFDEFDIEVNVSETYRPAVLWALANGVVDTSRTELDDLSVLTQQETAVLYAEFARIRGIEIDAIEEEVRFFHEKYPKYTEQQVRSLLFCFEHKILVGQGTKDTIVGFAYCEMERLRVVYSLYRYHLYLEPLEKH